MRAGLNAQFLGILVTLAGLLTFVLVLHNDSIDVSPARNVFEHRQAAAAPASVAAASNAADSSTPQAASTTTTPAASSSTSQQASTSTTPQTSAAQKASTQAGAQTTTTPTNAATKATAPTAAITSAIVTTDSNGQVVTSVIVVSDTPSSTSAAPTQTSSSNNSGGGGGISTSTIIGLSVAGGVAVLCVLGFFVWKLTRKRGDFDSNEEIKWPELNAHDDNVVPLPTNRTGGAGFDTEARRSSLGYAPSTAANSTAELHPDPYAVPPLPHLDPNQPYHDDPSGRYYDPYRGPIPQTFDHGEAIPMTQLAGRRSPGPADFGGRASPAPPAPPVLYGGADFGGRASPGPRAPYAGAGGRMSPGPQAAYGGGNAYGPR